MLVSPVLAGLAVAIGVPILLFYVYGVVPGKSITVIIN
jgi:E3 ubiquitin-protein ligase RNF19A